MIPELFSGNGNGNGHKKPVVSVVLPTSGRRDLLNRCLFALSQQDLDLPYEVVVADDAPNPGTRQQVDKWSLHFRERDAALHYIQVNGRHGPATLNEGWRKSHSDIIAFTDDESLPLPSWLRCGLSVFMEGISAVAGKVIIPLPDHPTDYEKSASDLERSLFATSNCFCRRADLQAVGGFDEHFSGPSAEDSDLLFSLLERGKTLARVDDAVVIHPVMGPKRWGVSLREQKKNVFEALLYKKHRQLYKQLMSPQKPWDYYGIVGALITTLASLISGLTTLALIASTLWLLGTARLCFRRLRGTSHSVAHITEMVVTSVLIPPLSIFWRLYGSFKHRVFFL